MFTCEQSKYGVIFDNNENLLALAKFLKINEVNKINLNKI